MEQEVKVKSLLKAIEVLECFTLEEPELGITEISKKLGLYKSNVHNIISTFMRKGYIERNSENQKYKLGIKMLEFSSIISSNISFRAHILPHMQKIADQANETVYLGIPNEEGEVVYLDSCNPNGRLPTKSMLGIKAPMYCTGLGKAMLSFLSEEKVSYIISKPLHKFTESTLVDKNLLLEDFEQTRKRGYSFDNMEHEYGVKCVGVPIFSSNGRVVAGLSLSGPSLRFDEDKSAYFARILIENSLLIKNKI